NAGSPARLPPHVASRRIPTFSRRLTFVRFFDYSFRHHLSRSILLIVEKRRSMTRGPNRILRFLASSLLMADASWLAAQSTTQSLQGLVTDNSGAVITGAKVTLTNQGTNVSLNTTTNETGNYSFPLIAVGDYTVKCEMPGFKAEVVRNLRLE